MTWKPTSTKGRSHGAANCATQAFLLSPTSAGGGHIPTAGVGGRIVFWSVVFYWYMALA